MTDKHPKATPRNVPRDDLETNPEIGQSKGTEKAGDIEPIRGESTVEGDVGNDAGPQGGAPDGRLGRTNK